MLLERPPQKSQPEEAEPHAERKETIEDFDLHEGSRLYNFNEGGRREDIEKVHTDERLPGGGMIIVSFTDEGEERKRRSLTLKNLIDNQESLEICPALDFTTLAVGSTIESRGSGTIREVVKIRPGRKDPNVPHFALQGPGQEDIIWATLETLKANENNIARIESPLSIDQKIAKLEMMLDKINTRRGDTPNMVTMEETKVQVELDDLYKKLNEGLRGKKKPQP